MLMGRASGGSEIASLVSMELGSWDSSNPAHQASYLSRSQVLCGTTSNWPPVCQRECYLDIWMALE